MSGSFSLSRNTGLEAIFCFAISSAVGRLISCEQRVEKERKKKKEKKKKRERERESRE